MIDEDKVMTVTESITGVFNSYTNGIVRNIPISQTIGVPDGNGGRTIRNYENEISNFTVLSQDAYLLDVVEDSGNMFYHIARTGGISSGKHTLSLIHIPLTQVMTGTHQKTFCIGTS